MTRNTTLLAALPLLLLWLLLPTTTRAQEYYRFRADFSIKEKNKGDAQGKLITGVVYYDKNQRKINHNVRFPAREEWLLHDTTMYRMVADTLVSKRTIIPIVEYSMYSMILNQQLADYGMAKTGYELEGVEEAGEGKVLSTWLPPQQVRHLLGKVLIMQSQKRIDALAFYDKDDKVTGKFYFKEYAAVSDLQVPGKIYQITYLPDGGEFTRILEFKNVVVNEASDDEKYDFRLPVADGGQ
jgi:hypothetical protein